MIPLFPPLVKERRGYIYNGIVERNKRLLDGMSELAGRRFSEKITGQSGGKQDGMSELAGRRFSEKTGLTNYKATILSFFSQTY